MSELTLKEAMKYTSLSGSTLKMLVDSGEIHDLGENGIMKFSEIELDEILGKIHIIKFYSTIPDAAKKVEDDIIRGGE